MRKIIKGRKYDTDTAKEICYTCGGQPSSFGYWCDTLYQKRTGEFFLHWFGGPLTKYAVHDGNETSGNSGIKPLSFEEARKFVEKYADVDIYEELFGEVTETGSTDPITLSLPPAAIRKLKENAVKQHITASALITQLIEKM